MTDRVTGRVTGGLVDGRGRRLTGGLANRRAATLADNGAIARLSGEDTPSAFAVIAADRRRPRQRSWRRNRSLLLLLLFGLECCCCCRKRCRPASRQWTRRFRRGLRVGGHVVLGPVIEVGCCCLTRHVRSSLLLLLISTRLVPRPPLCQLYLCRRNNTQMLTSSSPWGGFSGPFSRKRLVLDSIALFCCTTCCNLPVVAASALCKEAVMRRGS